MISDAKLLSTCLFAICPPWWSVRSNLLLKLWYIYTMEYYSAEYVSIDYFLLLILAHISWFFRCLIIFYYMLDTVMTRQEYIDLKNVKLHVH